MVTAAQILIWGELVGAVQWHEDRALASFQYAPSFLKKGYDLSPIHIPNAKGSGIFQFPQLKGIKMQQAIHLKVYQGF